MKVGLFVPFFPPSYSGAGQQAAWLVRELDKLGVEVEVITPRRMLQSQRIERVGRVTVRRHSGRWKVRKPDLLWLSLCQAMWIIRRRCAWDCALFFATGSNIYLPLICGWLLRLPCVLRISLLGSDDIASIAAARVGWLRTRILRRAAAVVCSTERILRVSQQALSSLDPTWESRCVLLPNGVNTSHFVPIKASEAVSLRRKLSIPASAVVGVSVGIVHPRKRFELLLEAWSKAHARLGETRLLLVGPRNTFANTGCDNAGYLAELDRIIRELNLSQVVMWRETQDVLPYLQVSDAFLFASMEEGFPNALLEAMSCGLPCFVVKRHWLPQGLIFHGETGYVTPDQAEAMAAQIVQSIETGNATRVGEYARKHIESHYSMERVSRSYLSLFSDLQQKITSTVK